MSRDVATRWLESKMTEESRLHLYFGPREIRKFPNLLRSFRDGKVALSGVSPLPDLGIEEHFDFISVWSSDKEALKTLAKWCEDKGLETSGLW